MAEAGFIPDRCLQPQCQRHQRRLTPTRRLRLERNCQVALLPQGWGRGLETGPHPPTSKFHKINWGTQEKPPGKDPALNKGMLIWRCFLKHPTPDTEGSRSCFDETHRL